MSLTSRLEKLETRHVGSTRIYVTRDGETYQSEGKTFTRAQMDALPDPVTVFRVVYEEQAVRP